MSAESLGWHDEQEQEERRRVRRAMSISIGVHVVLAAALVISPPASFEPLPQTISVELIAGPQIAAPVAPRAPVRRKASPPPAAKPASEPAPSEPAPPAPPKPKAPVEVLPENAPKPDKKVKQAPEKKTQEVAKAETPPAPEKKPAKEPPKTPAKEVDESLSYEDAMESLDDELGEDTTDDLLAPAPPRPGDRVMPTSGNSPESRAGVSLNAEDAAWGLAVRRKIGSNFVMPSNFRGRGLVTAIRLEITTSGTLVGEPEVQRSSGDPYFDDFALLAVVKAATLPPPPRPGQLFLLFSAEDY